MRIDSATGNLNANHIHLESKKTAIDQPTGFDRSLAIVIGINDYMNGIPTLKTPINDATEFARLLNDEHGYEVHLFTQEVTHAVLTTYFTQTLPSLNLHRQDRLLLYFAGHGIALDGEDGPSGYLIPQDAKPEDPSTFLAMRDLHEWLNDLNCRQMLAILDCCFAGAFRWASTRHVRPLPETIYQERYDRFIRDPAWQVITSAAYDQKALDFLTGNSLGERGTIGNHSPFAQSLFQALDGAGDLVPSGEGDGVITATELSLFLRDNVEAQVKELGRQHQTPQLWPLTKHDKGEYIFLVPGHELNLPPAPPLTTENNPYRGLQSYDEEHADLFFGRQDLVKQLAKHVDDHPLTVVLGASGTGKSSLVKAGLLPILRNLQHNTESQNESEESTDEQVAWHIVSPFLPSMEPLTALAQAISKSTEYGGLSATLQPRSITIQSLQNAIEAWLAQHANQKLVLVIDQYEELVTLCRDEAERMRFQTVLDNLINRHADQIHVIITLRTDFEPQFADSLLAAHWQAGRFIVPPMSQSELRAIIEGPASERILFFEPPNLVDTLIDEVIQTPGALPLLSFTLEQLYLKYLKRQEEAQKVGGPIERSLNQEDYDELGGVIGSLQQRADDIYDNLPTDAHKATMQRVMLRMIAVEGGELARRRVPLTELIYPSDAENERVQKVIDELIKARLVVSGGADIDGDDVVDAYVEPAHDALVRAWSQLHTWQLETEGKLPITLHRRLTQAAQIWQATENESDKLGLLWNNNPAILQLNEERAGPVEKRPDLLDYLLNPTVILGKNVLVRLWHKNPLRLKSKSLYHADK